MDIEDRLLDIFVTAEDGRNFAHGGRLKRDGLLEMAHEQHKAK